MTNLNEETKAGIAAYKTYRTGYGAVKAFALGVTNGMSEADAKAAMSAALKDLKEHLEIEDKHHEEYDAFRSFSKSASNAVGNIYGAMKKAAAQAAKAAKAAAELAAAKELEENPVEMVTTGEEAAAIDADYVAALREDVAGNAALIQACIDALTEELAAIA